MNFCLGHNMSVKKPTFFLLRPQSNYSKNFENTSDIKTNKYEKLLYKKQEHIN